MKDGDHLILVNSLWMNSSNYAKQLTTWILFSYRYFMMQCRSVEAS